MAKEVYKIREGNCCNSHLFWRESKDSGFKSIFICEEHLKRVALMRRNKKTGDIECRDLWDQYLTIEVGMESLRFSWSWGQSPRESDQLSFNELDAATLF